MLLEQKWGIELDVYKSMWQWEILYEAHKELIVPAFKATICF